MPKIPALISKKIMVIMLFIIISISMTLLVCPGKIYGDVSVDTIQVTGAGGATTVVVGGTLQMSASVLPEDATEKGVTWSLDQQTGLATISTSGLLTGKGVGTIFVIAIATDVSHKSGLTMITVIAPVPVTSITVTGAEGATTVVNGSNLQMSASVLPADATDKGILWSVANGSGSAEIISSSGLLTATAEGTVEVRATAADDSGIFKTCTITVTAPEVSPSPPTASEVDITGTPQAGQVLTGSYLYSDIDNDLEGASEFIWLSSDASDGTYAPITGAASKTFLLTSGQLNKFIKFEVMPLAATGTLLSGSPVRSDPTTIVIAEESSEDNPDISEVLAVIINPPSAQSSSSSSLSPSSPFASLTSYEKTIFGFVTLFYNRILKREPDIEGFNWWIANLSSGALTGSDLVYCFIFSDENKAMTVSDTNEEFLKTLYSLIFNRMPDEEGLMSWLANMSMGMTKEEVVSHFSSSAEFINLCNEYGVSH